MRAKTPFLSLLASIFIAFSAAACVAAENAPESPYVFLLDAESLAGYSEVGGASDGDFSTQNRWLTSLGIKSDPSMLWIGAYNGSYDRTNLFIAQEEGARQSTKLMTNNFSLALKKNFSETFVVRPVFFYNVVWVEETADETLGDGLYDYEDLGGGFENAHTFDAEQKAKTLTYGFQAFQRSYPNFTSLLSAFDPNLSVETDEKDFVGYKGTAGWEAPVFGDVRGALGYTLLYKDYTDKLTINRNGIRQGDSRADIYQEVTGSLFQKLRDWITVGVSSGVSHNDSNLDFYDTRNTAGLADDRFFEDYYDYFSFDVAPTVIFFRKMDSEGKLNAQLQLTYTFEGLYYPDRFALSPTGAITDEEQTDYSHVLAARLSIPVSSQLSWVTAGQYKVQDSNQEFEQFYLYNYEVWSLTSGVSFKS